MVMVAGAGDLSSQMYLIVRCEFEQLVTWLSWLHVSNDFKRVQSVEQKVTVQCLGMVEHVWTCVQLFSLLIVLFYLFGFGP